MQEPARPFPPEHLDLPDAIYLLRLMGELASLRNDPRSWRLAMLAAINTLLPAAASAAFILKNLIPDSPPLVVSLFDAGFRGENQRQAFLREFNTVPFHDPFSRRCINRLFESRGRSVTATRRELLDDDTWYKSAHVQEFRHAAGIDDVVFSIHQGSDRGDAVVLCAFRGWGDPAGFAARERAIIHALHAGLEWMYRAEEATHRLTRASALAPRLRQTLDYLLAGDTERQVAMKMSLSVHTVHDYVKALYVHFGVSSRGELLSRWVQTGGQLPARGTGGAAGSGEAAPAKPA